MADFAPVTGGAARRPISAATWRTRQNNVVCYSFAALCENITSSTNRKYISCCIMVIENRAIAMGNVCRKFHKVWTCDFWDKRADRHTDKLIAILHTPPDPPLLERRSCYVLRPTYRVQRQKLTLQKCMTDEYFATKVSIRFIYYSSSSLIVCRKRTKSPKFV